MYQFKSSWCIELFFGILIVISLIINKKGNIYVIIVFYYCQYDYFIVIQFKMVLVMLNIQKIFILKISNLGIIFEIF